MLILFQLTFDFINFANYDKDQAAHNRIINQCINFRLKNQHNLTAYSSIEYCRNNKPMFDVGM